MSTCHHLQVMVKIIPDFGSSDKMSILLLLFCGYYSRFRTRFLINMSRFTLRKNDEILYLTIKLTLKKECTDIYILIHISMRTN